MILTGLFVLVEKALRLELVGTRGHQKSGHRLEEWT